MRVGSRESRHRPPQASASDARGALVRRVLLQVRLRLQEAHPHMALQWVWRLFRAEAHLLQSAPVPCRCREQLARPDRSRSGFQTQVRRQPLQRGGTLFDASRALSLYCRCRRGCASSSSECLIRVNEATRRRATQKRQGRAGRNRGRRGPKAAREVGCPRRPLAAGTPSSLV